MPLHQYVCVCEADECTGYLFLCIYYCQLTCVFVQGTIISKTAMENYKEFGPTLFKMSIPFSPAKRLGVPEEVCVYSPPGNIYVIVYLHPTTWVLSIKLKVCVCVAVQISPAVCFLLSPAASYISGATLRVDAGQSLYHSMWDIPGTNTYPYMCTYERAFVAWCEISGCYEHISLCV